MHIHPRQLVTRTLIVFIGLVAICGGVACGGDDSPKDTQPQAGTSAAPSVLTNGVAGKACSADKDCGTGRCAKQLTSNGLFTMSSTAAPGGYCTFVCKLDIDCGDSGVCIGAMGGGGLFSNVTGSGGTPGMCMSRCGSSSECREGYRWADGLGQTLNADTGAAASSSNSSGSCQVAPETDKLSGAVAGTACTGDADCTGGSCLMSDAMGTSYPGGYCSGRCLADADCG